MTEREKERESPKKRTQRVLEKKMQRKCEKGREWMIHTLSHTQIYIQYKNINVIN